RVKFRNIKTADSALDHILLPGYAQKGVKSSDQRLIISGKIRMLCLSLLCGENTGKMPDIARLIRMLPVCPDCASAHLIAQHKGTHIRRENQRIDTGRIPALSEKRLRPNQ